MATFALLDGESRVAAADPVGPGAHVLELTYRDWDDYDVRRVPIETGMTTDCLRAVVTAPMLFA